MDRLGAGCGNVRNLVPGPKDGGSGGSYLSSGGNKPGAGGGTTTPAATAPAVTATPIKSLGKSGPDSGIDFGGAPRQTGTKIR
jgi:hypothetical protein